MAQKELCSTEGQTTFSLSSLALEAQRSSSSFHSEHYNLAVCSVWRSGPWVWLEIMLILTHHLVGGSPSMLHSMSASPKKERVCFAEMTSARLWSNWTVSAISDTTVAASCTARLRLQHGQTMSLNKMLVVLLAPHKTAWMCCCTPDVGSNAKIHLSHRKTLFQMQSPAHPETPKFGSANVKKTAPLMQHQLFLWLLTCHMENLKPGTLVRVGTHKQTASGLFWAATHEQQVECTFATASAAKTPLHGAPVLPSVTCHRLRTSQTKYQLKTACAVTSSLAATCESSTLIGVLLSAACLLAASMWKWDVLQKPCPCLASTGKPSFHKFPSPHPVFTDKVVLYSRAEEEEAYSFVIFPDAVKPRPSWKPTWL